MIVPLSAYHISMSGNKSNLSFLTERLTPRLIAFIKFGLTGVTGLTIDFTLTWLFKDELHVNKFLANGIGFTAAVMSNYIIHRNWTFKHNKSKAGPQFLVFFTVSAIGLLLNSAIIFLLDNMMSVNFYISKAVAIFIVFFWNFSANYFFVFKPRKEDNPI
jgi:putative flippase GtrA